MNFTPPKIYAITDTGISGISHAEQVEKLIAGGVRLIQLREKHASPREFYDSAKQVLELAHKSGVRIMINDRVDIALALRAGGVHVGQDDMPPEKAREILGEDAIIGFSTHTLEQVSAALELPIDYIAIGPIFATQTKEKPDPLVGLNGLREARHIAGNMPLVAIGGINADNLLSVFDAGATSAAMIGSIVSDPSAISERMRYLAGLSDEYVNKIKQL
ncbi:MAG: thiamine phosphate synthase [Acidobacteriota bacterium]